MASEGEVKITYAQLRMCLIAASVAFFCLILAPTQRTLYLIAASEVGQQVAQSDTGKAVTDEVRKLILKKLQKLNEAAQ